MSAANHFPATYQDARAAFRSAARVAGARLRHHSHPALRAPDGSTLSIDVAGLGPADPEHLVVLVSGTHGIEGFCGSACQTGLLRDGLHRQAPPGTGLLLVHALNPYGFAYETRVNEDNVDLNRNFVDHDRTPVNADYEDLHDALVPVDWHGPARGQAERRIAEFVRTAGPRWVQAAVTYGQYTRPDGLFYGGAAPVWSNHRWREIIRTHVAGRRSVAYVDLHTGLGARGAAEPIFRGGRDPDAEARARRWYGDALTVSEAGTSASTPITGNTAAALAAELGDEVRLTAITLEFGTVPGAEALEALRADNWLRLQEDPDPADVTSIKRSLREAFYPGEPRWRLAVRDRFQEVCAQVWAGLAAEGSDGRGSS